MTNAVTIAQSGSTGVASGFRNRLINGAFDFWQRGTAQTFINAGTYLADRWTCMGFQQARHQRVAVSNRVEGLTAQYAMRVSSSPNSDNGSGGTRMDLSQKIENANCYDLAGTAVVYSFWIRFSSPTATSIANAQNSAFGPFNSFIASSTTNTDAATSTDSIGSVSGQTVIANGSLPTTWTKITGTAIIPSNANNVALRLQFQLLGSTTNAGDVWYEVTELQLEEGTTSSGFDRRPYTTEEMLCQRQYENNYPAGYAVGSNSGINGCWFSVSLNGGDFYDSGRLTFLVPKRTDTPTVNLYNPVTGAGNWYDVNIGSANGNVGVTAVGKYGCYMYASTAFTANHRYAIRYTAEAEL